MNKVEIAVLGYGTVGSGVVEVLTANQEGISRRAGKEIRVKYVLDLRDFPNDPIQEKVVHDYAVILQDPDVKVVVEVMGGVEPAYTYVKQALLAGKSVATSNKELVARHGAELLMIAKENKLNFFYEASVGGGIPIIRPLFASLTADEIDEVSGILNGTTNYILSEMILNGSEFDTVLKQAQEMGYAERNPEADVEGYDAGRKIAILSSMVSEKQVDYESVYMEGITKITSQDILYARKLEHTIKLLARSKKQDGKLYAMVAPFLVEKSHPLYGVNGVFNAIFVHGNMLGDAMFYGQGAGKLPTASAVVADVVDAVKHMGTNVNIRWSKEKMAMGNIKDAFWIFFVRIPKESLSDAKALFGDVKTVDAGVPGEIGFLTDHMQESVFDEKAAKLPVISRIRMDR